MENGKHVDDLIGKNIVVYDLEIKRTIESLPRGWDSKDEMGISVGCAFDYRTNRYRVFMDDNIGELIDRLNEPGTLIVAFNHIQFDNDLLRKDRYIKTLGKELLPDPRLCNYDMLVESKRGAGVPQDAKISGFQLNDHLQILGLPLKTGDGTKAPILWQSGKIGAVIDYCLNDVIQERNLFEYIYIYRQLACRAFPNKYAVRFPELNLEN